ncbi:GMP synthase [glutamine-hydrolyzing],GMP synthase,3-methyladenine DNA glycosylase,GMP synthase (glutamine-hydrolyzing), C-terminal domain,GMP synthase C terminal domain [Chlamydia poikilotherma]|uniref:GMP synthase [glutamine-hydrolyzing] n=1 Tax=Chlamydia poikilotherma TaxID=1967783 RepID=A0A3B0Q0C0_9CHLA|nr:glutamine-hydrolyzing GMP synthase [Chlamydia poikilotherma]SYX09045.1 GMP synthase [glutamine-hydrolyzing],GMP synthase,3-methyladenine DNA glycosylase,GMP synthase (glutamine-hydrolyzing), C-terminal domain,GMP synthase C terminal domain [Chlamydia poikilotherma]
MSKILILDFGSQYTNILAKKIRLLSVFCEVLPWNTPLQNILQSAPSGLIFSGGPHSVYHENSPKVDREIYNINIPILGVCYGMQLIARDFGSEVREGGNEFGYTPIVFYPSELFKGLVDKDSFHTEIRMSHCDSVAVPPDDFFVTASSKHCPIAAIECPEKKLFGLQFHPEVSDSQAIGDTILSNFVKHVCQASETWKIETIEKQLINNIKDRVGETERVLLGLSGGVDSSVLAVLLHNALGDRLSCVFVNTGLLRKNEVEEVKQQFSSLGLKIIVEDASEKFFRDLDGIEDPEQKRKIIGSSFIEVFDEVSRNLEVQWLAQGTIYSDVIESAKSCDATQVIKSHHNVGGLPEKLNLKLLEPLRFLFKDEVRALGRVLGLPDSLISRHPFPGPGLGVRVLGKVCQEYVEIVKNADDIFIKELKKANLYHKVSQAFAVFLPIKSVAVKGDCRHYGYTIALRAVESTDFMTACWPSLSREFLNRCSSRIINEIPEVSRVVYDISDKPPATIEWE